MRRWILIAAGGGLALGLLLLAARFLPTKGGAQTAVEVASPTIARIARGDKGASSDSSGRGTVAGLDLLKIAAEEDGTTSAPALEGQRARLTVEPELQRTALGLMSAHRLPEAAIVMIDVATGNVIAYASHIDKGPLRDVCAEATAPAASVFKIVTGAALVEEAHLGPETKQCYSGGAERINPADLVDDPQRDRWCSNLSGAMGRSLNTVFARLAQKHLTPLKLETMARRLGFGEPVPFDVPVQPSIVSVPPADPLEYARTAAGFWHTTLSPLEAAWLSAMIARGGEAARPVIVRDVVDASGSVTSTPAPPGPPKRVMAAETAQALTTMMEHTVTDGTSFRAFHDMKGKSFLPNVGVAGKTGTLTDPVANRFYTWFTGFAPSHPHPSVAGLRTVAIAVLVVNQPTWQVKANVVARDMLRAYFAEQKVPSVTKPSPLAIARRKK